MAQEKHKKNRHSQPQVRRRPTAARRPSRYGKWRATVLALVYVLVAVHITHWKLAGKTLAPLEFNEVVYTFELGVVTAGFLFMAAALASALIFGRFFCSWGCHILALEDLCAWLLRKIRIRPRLIRSRFLMLVPLGAMLYIFLWPHLRRFVVFVRPSAADVVGEPPPFALRILTDPEGWASFVTTDFWRNLPGPGITILTLVVCGFAIVYLLGSRSFCTYICPYGAVFGLADRVAPGRIRLTGDCAQCGQCTAGCQSNVRVHEEIARYGMVVSPNCLKDLDCVGGCPENAISYRFGRPALFARPRQTASKAKRRHSIGLAEEFGLLAVFAVVLIIFVGLPQSIAPWAGRLYGVMPLFLSISLAVVTAFIVLHLWRLARRPHVSFQGRLLKSRGRIGRAGVAFLILASVWSAFVAHSGLVQYHMFRAGLVIERARSISTAVLRQDPSVLGHLDRSMREAVSGAERHLRYAAALGLFVDTRISRQRSWLALVRGNSGAAVAGLREAITIEPDNPDTFYQLGRVLAVRGEFAEAARMLAKADELSLPGGLFKGALIRGATQLIVLGLRGQAVSVMEEGILLRPGDLALREHLVHVLLESGANEAATDVLGQILELWPDHHSARIQLAELLLNTGSTARGLAELRTVLRDQPDNARAHVLLGRAMLSGSHPPREAITHLEKAVARAGGDPDLRADLAQAYLQIGEFEKAEVQIRENLKNPDARAGSLYMLGELRRAQGREAQAVALFRRAHALNPRFPAPQE